MYEGISSGNLYFRVELTQPFYIEYILVTGEANDMATRTTGNSYPIVDADCSAGYNNFFWTDVKVYANNIEAVEECCDSSTECGAVAAQPFSEATATDEASMLELAKMGGTVDCPTGEKSQYIWIEYKTNDFNMN